jgi:ABC-type uncharacterized transport system ATPase subunit
LPVVSAARWQRSSTPKFEPLRGGLSGLRDVYEQLGISVHGAKQALELAMVLAQE